MRRGSMVCYTWSAVLYATKAQPQGRNPLYPACGLDAPRRKLICQKKEHVMRHSAWKRNKDASPMIRDRLRLLALGLVLTLPVPAMAQDQVQADLAAAAEEVALAETALLTPEEIDTLIGPVALFTDNLLAQVLTATTYPLDVVKADRLLAESKDLSDKARADAVAAKDWDESVKQLATGFPTVINRMAEHIDWTEQVGQAILAQTDDVLDSIQRLRAVAEANGYLESNAAQVVEVTESAISIAPANPEVIYVPTYEPSVVYTTVAPATPYYVSDDDDWEDALTAGAIFFGSAILINEIFDDNDWDGYWGGRGSIDWDNGDFNARPGIDINGDVNIDRGDITVGGDRFTNIDRDSVNIDRNRINADRSTVNNRIGDLDRDALDKQRDKSFKPADADRDAARAKIEDRKARGGDVAKLPVGTGDRQRPAAKPGAKGPEVSRPAASTRPSIQKPERALPGATASRPTATRPSVSRPTAAKPAKVSRPTTAKRPTASRPQTNKTAFSKSGGARAAAAGSRGKASAGGRRR